MENEPEFLRRYYYSSHLDNPTKSSKVIYTSLDKFKLDFCVGFILASIVFALIYGAYLCYHP